MTKDTRGEISYAVIAIILVLAILFFTTPLFGKITNSGNRFFNALGIEKECTSTKKTFSEYNTAIEELKAKIAKGALNPQEVKNAQTLCTEFKTCFSKEYELYKQLCESDIKKV